MTTKTNELIVTDTARDTVGVTINGEVRRVTWGELRQAAEQDDRGLAAAYAGLLAQAEAMAAAGPVDVTVRQDSTHVWWVAAVTASHGGGRADYPSRRDEGMTHPSSLSAELEAADVCDRLGKRVERRTGFDAAAARAKRDAIVAK